jgi:hypothetical protein
MGGDVDVIDFIKIRLLVVNDIPKVITVLKNVLTWIDKYLQLIGDEDLQSYQENVLFVI